MCCLCGFVRGESCGYECPHAQLTQRLASIPNAQVHLVLNAAAYETPLLRRRGLFANLPIQDVIVTHLDEETR